MNFWDASALVPLFALEAKTPDVRAILSRDAEVAVWWACRTEVKSAIYRKGRERVLAPSDVASAVSKVDISLGGQAVEISPDDKVREEADAILSRHQLRAADAYHLAAWRLYGSHLPFVCLDQRLLDAALAEGTAVLP